jgi:hypothetical protein
MRFLGAHEQMRLKVTAFLFNNRADALRGEIYRALCLHVLDELGEPCSREDIIELIAYILGNKVEVTHGLRTILVDELNRLTSEGVIGYHDECYFLQEGTTRQLPDAVGQEQLYKTISQELREVAVSISREISSAQLDSLLDFYIEVSDIVAQHEMGFVCRGYGIEDIVPALEETRAGISECRERYSIDRFIDVEQFILRTLIHPGEVLSNYLHRLIQVHVITQLLTWDPTLEYLQNTILSGKTLYIDSSVLFSLMQRSNPQYHFLRSLLKASHDDLGVRLKLHEITLDEYKRTFQWANMQFEYSHRDIRNIARICQRDGDDPADYIDSSLFADYVNTNIEHIDLGSWQRYSSYCSGKPLEETLASFSIDIDKTSTYVHETVFQEIKDALLRASRIQMERGKRSRLKDDTTHDAKIYHLIDSTRHRKHQGEISWGYDTYLLTLDGSLVHFRKLHGIPWTETYFLFPNQWYTLTFPFLRMRTSENPGLAAGLASLVFSGAFPDLISLVPLELCKYVFDAGGTDLPMGSIRNVVEGFVEEKLVESLDPANQDQRRREEANIRVQRLIVNEELKQRRTAEKLEVLKEEHGLLKADIDELTAVKTELAAEVAAREAEIEGYGGIEAKIQVYERQLAELRDKYVTKLQEKDEELAARDERLEQLQNTLQRIEQMLRDNQEEKERARQQRAKQMLALKKSIVTILMLSGLILVLPLLIQFGIEVGIICASLGFMAVGSVLYHSLSSNKWAFAVYGLGLLVAGGVILIRHGLDTWQWIIPMVWEVLTFAIDRRIGKHTSE